MSDQVGDKMQHYYGLCVVRLPRSTHGRVIVCKNACGIQSITKHGSASFGWVVSSISQEPSHRTVHCTCKSRCSFRALFNDNAGWKRVEFVFQPFVEIWYVFYDGKSDVRGASGPRTNGLFENRTVQKVWRWTRHSHVDDTIIVFRIKR